MLCFVISATAASGSSCYGSGPNSHLIFLQARVFHCDVLIFQKLRSLQWLHKDFLSEKNQNRVLLILLISFSCSAHVLSHHTEVDLKFSVSNTLFFLTWHQSVKTLHAPLFIYMLLSNSTAMNLTSKPRTLDTHLRISSYPEIIYPDMLPWGQWS